MCTTIKSIFVLAESSWSLTSISFDWSTTRCKYVMSLNPNHWKIYKNSRIQLTLIFKGGRDDFYNLHLRIFYEIHSCCFVVNEPCIDRTVNVASTNLFIAFAALKNNHRIDLQIRLEVHISIFGHQSPILRLYHEICGAGECT